MTTVFLCSRSCPHQADTKRLALHSATAVDAGPGLGDHLDVQKILGRDGIEGAQ